MKKNKDGFTARELILAKADIVSAMPEYKPIETFEQWSSHRWRFDSDQYANDTEYKAEMDTEYEHDCRERKSFNYVLEQIYQVIA